jgi:hypothetical protein
MIEVCPPFWYRPCVGTTDEHGGCVLSGPEVDKWGHGGERPRFASFNTSDDRYHSGFITTAMFGIFILWGIRERQCIYQGRMQVVNELFEPGSEVWRR